MRSEPGFGVLISFFVWTVFSASVQKLIPNNSDPVVKLYFKDVSPRWSRPESLEVVWCHRPIIVACSWSVTFKFLFNYLRREKNVTGRIFTEGVQCGVYLHTNWIYQYGLDQDQIPISDQIIPVSPSDWSIMFDKRQKSLQLISPNLNYSHKDNPDGHIALQTRGITVFICGLFQTDVTCKCFEVSVILHKIPYSVLVSNVTPILKGGLLIDTDPVVYSKEDVGASATNAKCFLFSLLTILRHFCVICTVLGVPEWRWSIYWAGG